MEEINPEEEGTEEEVEYEEVEYEEEGQTLVFGIPVEDVDANIQPIDVLVMIKGINMETGAPMMITVGSGGIPIWEIIGMLDMELCRLRNMALYATSSSSEYEPDEE